jgi:hypothetical protein
MSKEPEKSLRVPIKILQKSKRYINDQRTTYEWLVKHGYNGTGWCRVDAKTKDEFTAIRDLLRLLSPKGRGSDPAESCQVCNGHGRLGGHDIKNQVLCGRCKGSKFHNRPNKKEKK